MSVEVTCVIADKGVTADGDDLFAIVVAQFEVCMNLIEVNILAKSVGPNHEVAACRDYGVRNGIVLLNLVLQRLVDVVAKEQACDVDVGVCGVVKFNPVATLPCFVCKHCVTSTYLVDLDRCGDGFLERRGIKAIAVK